MSEHSFYQLLAADTELLRDPGGNSAVKIVRRLTQQCALTADCTCRAQHSLLPFRPSGQRPFSIGSAEDVVATLAAEIVGRVLKNAHRLRYERHDVNVIRLVNVGRDDRERLLEIDPRPSRVAPLSWSTTRQHDQLNDRPKRNTPVWCMSFPLH